MRTKKSKIKEKSVSNFLEKRISRKEAIKKTGYMAASAATMMILLNKNANGAPVTSGANGAPVTRGNNGWGNGDQNPPGNSGNHNNAENNNSGKKDPTKKIKGL